MTGVNGTSNGRPHDTAAERAVLGACLLGNKAIVAEASLVLGTNNGSSPFLDNRNAGIWATIQSLTADDIVPDMITVSERAPLSASNWKTPGDDLYLAELYEHVQQGVDHLRVGHYAKIVAGAARVRAAEESIIRLRKLLSESLTDLDNDRAGRIGADLTSAVDALVTIATPERPKQRLEFLSVRELSDRVAEAGPRTWLLKGLWPHGDYGVHAAEPKAGKAQPLHAPVATPTGWTTIGDLAPGDTILGADGLPQKVEAVYDRGPREVWEVQTGDGSVVECCGEHLWAVAGNGDKRRRPGRYRVMTTEEVAGTVRRPEGTPRWHLPVGTPVQYASPAPALIDPYLLGLLLGDGCLTREILFTSGDPELLQVFASLMPDRVQAVGGCDSNTVRATGTVWRHNPLLNGLRSLGLMGHRAFDKFIPPTYLRQSVENRLALLQGLMDTDGTIGRTSAYFSTVSPQLAEGVCELARSLGGTASPKWRVTNYHHLGSKLAGQRSCNILVRLPLSMNPFRLARKADKYSATIRTEPSQRIVSVRRTGVVTPMRCIAVSNPDHLYRTTNHIVTHNTWNTTDLCIAVASGTLWMGHVDVHTQGNVLMLAGEGGEIDLHQRLTGVASGFGFDLNDLPITVCTRAPHITNPVDMRQLKEAIENTNPVLVTLDPLYLAARGASMSNLNEMGAHLEEIQHLCQDAGASLWVATHFNRKEGSGAARITGAGPAEWGRVLATATIVSRREDRDTKESAVVTEIAFIGGSIGDHKMRVVRRIRRMVPDDINSAYVYSVSVEEQDAEEGDGGIPNAVQAKLKAMPPATKKMYNALRTIGKPSTRAKIVDEVARVHGNGLTRPVSSKSLHQLLDAALVSRQEQGPGIEAIWTIING